MASRIVVTLATVTIPAGCFLLPGLSSGADAVGQGDSCQISDSSRANGDREVAEVRESICETSAVYLAPDVASIFIFVRDRSERKDPSNVVMRYEVVCRDGDCAKPPKVRWPSRSSLLITLTTFGDIYCLQRTTIGHVSISYSKTPLREPPQDAFTDLEGLCQ